MIDAYLPASMSAASETFASLRTPLWVFDIDRRCVVWANPAAIRVWGAADLGDLRGRDMRDMSPAIATRLHQYQTDFEQRAARFEDTWTIYPHGQPRSLRVMISGVRLDDGRMGMFCEAAASFDEAPQSLRSAEALLHTSVMITLYDADGVPLYRNPAARAAVPAAEAGAAGVCARFVQAEDRNACQRLLDTTHEGRLVAQIYCSQGIRWHDLTVRPCTDAVTGQRAWLVSEVDVTELKKTEQMAHFLASYDVLTNLPNRSLLQAQADSLIVAAQRDGMPLAVLFIDIDRFKTVNDSLGRPAGDDLLREVARRLKNELRGADIVGRLSGDEFVAVLPNAHATQATATCERLNRELARPCIIDDMTLSPSACIGISLFPADGRDIDTLLRHADMAMHEAKLAGRGQARFYNAGMNRLAQESLALEVALRDALARDRLSLYYQPQIRLESGELYGVESLTRWHHPQFGEVSPARFVPLAEECGLIAALGLWALGEACAQLARWRRDGMAVPAVSVNLSPSHFRNRALPRLVADILDRHGLAAGDLTIEVTESLLMDSHPATVATLADIHRQGIRLSLDDFGTGYSSLGYLRRLPINELKLDKSFVNDLQSDGRARALASAVIQIGQSLDLTVVAEGVESAEQRAFLAETGCAVVQGYLLSPALSAGAFADWLLTWRGALTARG